MAGLADSTAILEPGRLLSQHQAALTLLQRSLADPNVACLRWLDLACGKGQILVQLEENLSVSERAKISYVGYDLSLEFSRITEQRARQLSFQDVRVHVGELANFSKVIDGSALFDFITLTNTIHEIDPGSLAAVLYDCIDRLADQGFLFIYDMETLPNPELGSVPWRRAEISSIIEAMLRGLGIANYTPAVGRWGHRSVYGWNIQIEKKHIVNEVNNIIDRRDPAINATRVEIIEILRKRRSECQLALDSLTKYGSSTGNETAEEIAYLYEFWAIQRALDSSA